MILSSTAPPSNHLGALAGDPPDRDAVVLLHLPMARRMAARFVGPGVSRDDLTQVASIGLIHAVDRYDGGRGVPFVAYAVVTIRGELRHYVRVCRRVGAMEVDQLDGTPPEASGNDPALVGIEQRLVLEQALSTLDQRSRRIVLLRFVRDLTLREIAGELSLSEGHVSRLLSRSLEVLRGELDAHHSPVPRRWPA